MRRMAWILGVVLGVALSFPAWSYAGDTMTLTLKKTVGPNPTECGTAKQIVVTPGTTVYYCYMATNTGAFSLTTHDLEDSVLGKVTLPGGGTFDLEPGQTKVITAPYVVNATTVNVATWTATGDDSSMVDTAPVAADIVQVTATSSAEVVIGAQPAPALGEWALAFVAAALLVFGALRLSSKLRDPA